MMEEYSRPATLEDLKTLIRSLNAQGVEYLLIGGYALFAHGYHRATTDIDLLVPAGRESGKRLKAALMVLPDQAARDIDPAWFDEGENIRVADAFVVDIMLNACGESYETLKRYAETVDLDGIPIRTINLEGLLLRNESEITSRFALSGRRSAQAQRSRQTTGGNGEYLSVPLSLEPTYIFCAFQYREVISYLFLTKQTMRDKDIADRVVLERALEICREHSRHP